jgi:hypothetical protein
MLAMKDQFPHLRNGLPWWQKDTGDTDVLRELAAAEGEGSTAAAWPTALRAPRSPGLNG